MDSRILVAGCVEILLINCLVVLSNLSAKRSAVLKPWIGRRFFRFQWESCVYERQSSAPHDASLLPSSENQLTNDPAVRRVHCLSSQVTIHTQKSFRLCLTLSAVKSRTNSQARAELTMSSVKCKGLSTPSPVFFITIVRIHVHYGLALHDAVLSTSRPRRARFTVFYF